LFSSLKSDRGGGALLTGWRGGGSESLEDRESLALWDSPGEQGGVADFALLNDLHVVLEFVDEVASGAVGAVALLVVQLALSGSVVLVNVHLSFQLRDAVGVSALSSVVAELVLLPVPAHFGLVLDLVQRVLLLAALLLGSIAVLERAESSEVGLSFRVVVIRILVGFALRASAAHLVLLAAALYCG